MYNAKAYSVASATSPFVSTTIARRDPTETDVQIEILFCGICHSDLHTARNEWGSVMPTVYPCVPGHEIVGRVTKVGSAVTSSRWATSPASAAWWTPMAPAPSARLELSSSAPAQPSPITSPDKHLGGVTYGGYSDSIVVDERFVLRVPANLDLAGSRAAALRRHHHLLADAPSGA